MTACQRIPGDRQPELRRRRELSRLPAGTSGPDQGLQQHLQVPFPGPKGRGRLRGHRGLARRAQPPQAARQGRNPVLARRQRGRGPRARRPHDLQMRDRRRAVRRSEGRHQDRPAESVPRAARAHHAPLHGRAHEEELHRARDRRAGSRLRDGPAGDVLDRRHVRPVPSRRDRRDRLRHGQADQPGRHPRAQGGHGPRRLLRREGGARGRGAARDAGPLRRPRRASASSCRGSATSGRTRRDSSRRAAP